MDVDDRYCAMSRSSIFTDQENIIHNHRLYPGTTVFITYETHMSRSLLRSELAKNTHVSYTRLSPEVPIEQTANEGNKVTYGAYCLGYCEQGRAHVGTFLCGDTLTLTTSPSFLT